MNTEQTQGGLHFNLPANPLQAMTGREPKTTFWRDFCIADMYGLKAIQDTYDRAFAEWKTNTEYITEFAVVLNHKIWYFYEAQQAELRRAAACVFATCCAAYRAAARPPLLREIRPPAVLSVYCYFLPCQKLLISSPARLHKYQNVAIPTRPEAVCFAFFHL